MSLTELRWIKFRRKVRDLTLNKWDRLTGGKRTKAEKRIIIEIIECQQAWEVIERERVEDFAQINREFRLNEGQLCSELEKCMVKYLEKMLDKAFELRSASLREVPSVGWHPHFDEFRDSLSQKVDVVLGTIPDGVRSAALQYPSGGYQSDGALPNHFLTQEFHFRVNQQVDLLRRKAEMSELNGSSGQDVVAKKGNRIQIAGIIITVIVPVALAWWSISESRSQNSKSSTNQTETGQDSKVQSSPNASVIQSGRDTIINNPPLKVEVKPESKPEQKQPGQAQVTTVPKPNTVQTMVNSPGGIQALGNVTIASDQRIIHTMELRVSLEIETLKAAVSDETRDVGLTSIVALFTKDGSRIRFESDATIRDQQVSPDVRRLSFVYRPENPSDMLGKPVASLASLEAFAVDYSEILNMKQIRVEEAASRLFCIVLVNGVAVGQLRAALSNGTIAKRGLSWTVEKVFAEMPTVYAEALSRSGRKQ